MKTELQPKDLLKIDGVKDKQMAQSIFNCLDVEECTDILELLNTLDKLKELHERECDKQFADEHLNPAIHYLETMLLASTVHNPNYVFQHIHGG